MIGERFGRLVVVSVAGRRAECLCDCGTRKSINRYNLLRSATRSCGCLQRELVSKRLSTHRKTGTREYRAWAAMRTRCTNPRRKQFKDWGGRGINICARWENFENFLADMGQAPEGTSLDRIDVDGNYCRENCRWATRVDQARNARSNRLVTYQGERMPLSAAAERAGLPYYTVHSRLRIGWSEERALSEPVIRRSA